MQSQKDRIKRFQNAYPELASKMSDKEIIQYLNYHKMQHKEINAIIQ